MSLAGTPKKTTVRTTSSPANLLSLHDAPLIPEGNYELRILQSLRRIVRAIEIHSQHLNHVYQITGPQLGCLQAIKQNGAMTPTRLARTLYLSASTVVGIVDRLEEKGLLSRLRSTEDRRQVQVCLTTAGDLLAESSPSPLQETLARSLKILPTEEQISITVALDKLVRLMEAGEISAAPILETGPLHSTTTS